MDQRTQEAALAVTKFGIGQPVPRAEDPTLVRGAGRYTDDVSLPGQAYAVMVRSTQAHGVIRGIDTAAAKAMPGVLAVYTAADLTAYGGMKCGLPLKNRDGSGLHFVPRPALASDRVRFVGDPVACVIAQTVAQAKDAAEAVAVDIDPLPVVTLASEAAKPGAPVLYPEVPDNIALDYQYGDAEKVDAAFQSAARVVSLPIRNTRCVVNAIEPRAAIGEYDPKADKWTLHSCSQGVMGMKGMLVDVLKTTPDKVRVLTGNVGGSFGMKSACYPEYICILHGARMLGRPVKWTDERSGSFVSDHHGRDHEVTIAFAFDTEGKILAQRLTGFGNMGGFLSYFGPLLPTGNAVKNINGMYRTPLMEVATKCVYTNTTHVSAYRGAGRPEGNYYTERALDYAASELGIDRLELRKRNFIRKSELPFPAASGMKYDCGDFPGLLKQALESADVKGFNKRKRESKKRGRLRGLGIGCYLEVTAAPGKEMAGLHFNDDSTVTIRTGTLDYGQGHWTPFAQVLNDRLGIPLDKIKLLQGDSDALVMGGGTGGSRSITLSGAAIVQASAKVIEKGKDIAAHVLEASAGDIEFKNGRFVIAGTDRSIGILELAEKLRGGLSLPDGAATTLDVTHITDDPVPSAFPNGCHVCEVEIDPDTGRTEVVKYSAVNDFGTVVNPLLVEGQIHGGVVQGIGQALMENCEYDSEGQLVTGSYMDYAMPRASGSPEFLVESHAVPTKSNPLGTKGCGEAGCAGGLASVMNAVVDALSDYGIKHLDMPASPQRVWQAIQDAKAKG
ncbi:MAG TPA: xanthine dehydrogenase family protein molybdopterin-binding subunit [Pseudolabrys sp.]|nr:xanthine dehydrogenase family protein molybdopterin-binding subunit [Pseudolabrys sp.]